MSAPSLSVNLFRTLMKYPLAICNENAIALTNTSAIAIVVSSHIEPPLTKSPCVKAKELRAGIAKRRSARPASPERTARFLESECVMYASVEAFLYIEFP